MPRLQSLLLCFLTVVPLVLATAGEVVAAGEPLVLTLKESVRLAVEKNLEVKAELFNPAIGEAELRKSRGIYDPLLSIFSSYQESTTQSTSSFLSGAKISRQKYLEAGVGISQLLPSGGSVGLTFNNLWNRNNSDSTVGFLNEYWQSDLGLSFSQPLLKNFGREPTELVIAVAMNNKLASVDQFLDKLIDVVTRVRTAYYTLYSLRENLEAKKTALALSRKILDETRGRVRAGVLPAMEILNAEYGVASREKELIDAEKVLRDQVDVVRLLLQLDGAGEIMPVDKPLRENYSIDEAEALSQALERRFDLKSQRLSVRTLDLQARVAHNRIMPDLSFNASAALTGLGKDYGRDLDKLGTSDYPVWGVGLQFTYPLGNRDAENEFVRNRLKAEQARVQLKNLEETIRNEVKSAIRGVRANYLQLDVADRGLAYAEERLRAYIKKNEVGLATTKEVIDVQNDLVAAKTNQIRARAEYTIAIGQFWRATGELLEREGILLNGEAADRLYSQYVQ
ncbi:MAG TPA: TolC family protein [Geobacteraceae bacterium]|nr:TolC family protein [Geobacteraceae bacterium]